MQPYSGCKVCFGKSGNGKAPGTKKPSTCTGHKCKTVWALRAAQAAPVQLQPQELSIQLDVEAMPDHMAIHGLVEILGERCCVLRKLTAKQRRSGPRAAYEQQFLVRGTFLEHDDDDDRDDASEDDEDVPEPSTYWVNQADLLEAGFDAAEIKDAIRERHERVMEQWMEAAAPKKKSKKS